MEDQFDFFSKISIQELTNFFRGGQEESDKIEFKSGDSTITNLYKEICAFANTDGGVIIYGSPMEQEIEIDSKKGTKKKEKRKICKGDLIPSKEDKTKESLIQMIMTGISPTITGINVNKISCGNGFVYIIFVPKSRHSPHQVKGCYYIRIDSMSEPAPHGIVQALFNQKHPIDLEAQINIFNNYSEKTLFDFQLSVTNKTNYPAKNIEALIMLVGGVREKIEKDKEEQFQTIYLKKGKNYLKKAVKFQNTAIANIWCWHNFFNLKIIDDYFYCEIYVWAHKTSCLHKLFKVYKTLTIEQIDLTNNSAEENELREWEGYL